MEKLNEPRKNEMMLVNIVEDMVKEKIDEMIGEFDMCECALCRLNASAIALNNLPSHYVTTQKGALLGKMDDWGIDYQTNVTVEVAKALRYVKEHPLH